MYMNKSVVYLFVSVLFLFTSCEYRLGENFVDLGKLQVDSVLTDVQFYGFAYHQDEKAYVAENSGAASCELFISAGFEVERMIVRLGEMEWESTGKRCDFMLDMDRIPNGSYELSCEVFARMNNGTVAGQVGAEQYVEKRSWPLKINARTGSDKNLRYRMDENGHPEIFWDVDESLRDGFDLLSTKPMLAPVELTKSIFISKMKPSVLTLSVRLSWMFPIIRLTLKTIRRNEANHLVYMPYACICPDGAGSVADNRIQYRSRLISDVRYERYPEEPDASRDQCAGYG